MARNLTLLLFSILYLGIPLSHFSQAVKFRRLTVDHGMPTNTVFSIAQDKLGFIWMGTANGLCRYDGQQIRVFKNDPEDSSTLHHDVIRHIYVDLSNRLWVSSRYGLSIYDPVTEKFNSVPLDTSVNKSGSGRTGISGGNVTNIVELNGKYYIGTFGAGLNVYDTTTKTFTHYLHDKSDSTSIPSNNIRTVNKDKRGFIWLATLDAGIGVLDINTGKFRRITTAHGLPTNEVRNIFVDRNYNVWISCWANGTLVLDNKGKFIYASDPEFWGGGKPWGLVSTFWEDRTGRIWMATAEHGIGWFDPVTHKLSYLEHIPENLNSIGDKTVFCVMEDRSGVIWSGTWHGGVNIYDPKAHMIEHYHVEPYKDSTLNSNTIWTFRKKKNSDKILIGTAKYINEFDPSNKTFARLPEYPELKGHPSLMTIAQSIFEDYKGNLWVGSNGSGVYRRDPVTDKFRQYYTTGDSNSFVHHTVLEIVEDLNHTVWFGTVGGLCRYNEDKDNFTSFYHNPADTQSLSSDYIIQIVPRKDGKLWLITTEGLNIFSTITGKVSRILHNPKDTNSIPDNDVSCATYGADGKFWIGSSKGITCYIEEEEKFTRYPKAAAGFPDVEFYGMAEDDRNILWIITNNGAFSFDPKTGKCRQFEPSDGIQSREFGVSCIYKDESGKIYAGGVNGFNIIDPNNIPFNHIAPPVVFTGFSVLNAPWPLPQSIEYTKEIELSYREYFFSLHFAALEFSDPSRNRFRYFIEGLTEEWIDLGNTSFITFTNLAPGEYRLKVQACNNHGVWNESSTELRLIITPPFYKTTWFYTICGLFLAASTWGFIKWRERKLMEEKAHLESVVAQRTYELREEKEKVDAAHKDIKDSINYAKRIQEATLPLVGEIERELPGSFVLFKPRDIVSGDFYWFHKKGSLVYIAAADCTGHGVPGALMSMIGSSLLNQIMAETDLPLPGEVLNRLNTDIRTALKQNMADSETRDGMDIALVSIDISKREIRYAGANRPLLIIRKEIPEVEEIRADKYPIGGTGNESRTFQTHTYILNPGDTIYIFSDGYPDQFGGDTGKKFMTKNFKRMLMLYNQQPIPEIGKMLDMEFEGWKGIYEQVDDVLVIGIRL